MCITFWGVRHICSGQHQEQPISLEAVNALQHMHQCSTGQGSLWGKSSLHLHLPCPALSFWRPVHLGCSLQGP